MSNGKNHAEKESVEPPCPIFQLIPGVQSYDWGKLANAGSLVAKYAGATKELDFHCESDRPYAELWMGTHPTLPSSILDPTGQTASTSTSSTNGTKEKQHTLLADHLSQHPSLLGEAVCKRFDGPSSGLPFLFKILSIGKALSIQAHPDKSLAQRLHAERPKSYKDANHKPEMTIALTQFRGFCGFRPLSAIVGFVQSVPELRNAMDLQEADVRKLSSSKKTQESASQEGDKALLKDLFAKLMKADEADVKKQVTNLVQRYERQLGEGSSGSSIEDSGVSKDLAELVVKLNKQYPADVGILCTYFLNVIDLQPGEAMFLQANEPHAYIEGDIVECMAASDNVVRAGLTPKERDVDVLVDMLTYEMVSSGRGTDEKKLEAVLDTKQKYELMSTEEQRGGRSAPSNTTIYDPPIEEFTVLKTVVPSSSLSASGEQRTTRHRPFKGPSILLVTEGKGELTWLSGNGEVDSSRKKTLALEKAGQVFFIGADTAIELRSSSSEEGEGKDLVVFRAFVEV